MSSDPRFRQKYGEVKKKPVVNDRPLVNITNGEGICLLLEAILHQAAADIIDQHRLVEAVERKEASDNTNYFRDTFGYGEDAKKFLASPIARMIRKTSKDEDLAKVIFTKPIDKRRVL